MMPKQEHFTAIMQLLDVRKSHSVVVYDTTKGWFANRAAFMLASYGHPNVRVLDGGLQKWVNEKRLVENDDDTSTTSRSKTKHSNYITLD